MTSAKYLSKKIIDQKQSRDLNPRIQDTAMFTFEINILLDKDDIEKIFDDSVFYINDKDARVSNWFRKLYMLDQDLTYKNPKY